MTRFLALLAAVLLPSMSFANSCDIDTDTLAATYRITTTRSADDASTRRMLTLWRLPDRIAHAHPDDGYADLWNRVPNNRYHLIRQFEEARRGIEYEPNAVPTGAAHWTSLRELITPTHRERLKRTGVSGDGCDRVETYRGEVEDTRQTLEWLPAYALPRSLVSSTDAATIAIELVAVRADPEHVRSQFDRWSTFQTTDYADIGDNESDPFLRKMIRLGFIQHGSSGFYDASGQAMDGGHHH